MAGSLELLAIDGRYFNSEEALSLRLRCVDAGAAGAMRTTLKYLYFDSGPVNLPRDRLKVALPYLDAAETILIRWLQTRTNGSLRSVYGQAALRAARRARYKCSVCDHADVRTLNLDHIEGRAGGAGFACLCANCHTIKSRKHDWSGYKRPSVDET